MFLPSLTFTKTTFITHIFLRLKKTHSKGPEKKERENIIVIVERYYYYYYNDVRTFSFRRKEIFFGLLYELFRNAYYYIFLLRDSFSLCFLPLGSFLLRLAIAPVFRRRDNRAPVCFYNSCFSLRLAWHGVA